MLKAEAGDEWEVVAVARLVAHTVICTLGPLAAVEPLVFGQERSIVDKHIVNFVMQAGTDQYVVDGIPVALVAIGAFCSVPATGFG